MKIGKDLFHERSQGHRLQVQFHPARLQRGNGEQILDQQVQPLGVARDDLEETLGHLRIIARAVQQRLDVALDERQRRAQFMADVGDEFLARAFELLEPRQIMEDEDRALAFTGGIGDHGGVDLQPAFVQIGQPQFMFKHLALGLDAFDQLREFVQPQRLHDRLAAQLGLQAEQVLERAVGEINLPVAVEQQQPFQHRVEQHLLLRLGVTRRLLLLPAENIHLRLNLPLLAQIFLPPCEMQGDQCCQRKQG